MPTDEYVEMLKTTQTLVDRYRVGLQILATVVMTPEEIQKFVREVLGE